MTTAVLRPSEQKSTRAHWLAPARRAWMTFGELVHHTVGPVVMGIIFLGAFTPVVLVMKAIEHDKRPRSSRR